MRVLIRLLLVCVSVASVVVVACLGWLFFYSRDLPDFNNLARFSPTVAANVSDPCEKKSLTAIPYDAIGMNLRAALNSVEGSETGPTTYQKIMREFGDVRETRPALSDEVARTMFCSPERTAARQLKYLRTALQLDRRFSRQELFTIAANRYYFANDVVGVQAASQYFFHRDPRDLSIADAALLAGLVRAPAYYSLVTHPDRALKRRNDVLDAMAKYQAISMTEAEAAKSEPLSVATP